MTEYRKGQIWYDEGLDIPTIRWIVSDKEHIAFWPRDAETEAVPVTRENNIQIASYKSTLIHNPPQEWAVGDVVPDSTELPFGWLAEYDNGHREYVAAYEGAYNATILWIDTKEN